MKEIANELCAYASCNKAATIRVVTSLGFIAKFCSVHAMTVQTQGLGAIANNGEKENADVQLVKAGHQLTPGGSYIERLSYSKF